MRRMPSVWKPVCPDGQPNQKDRRTNRSMSVKEIQDLEAIKARVRATWSGNYPRVGLLTEKAANEFIVRLRLKPGMKVLDVCSCARSSGFLPVRV